MELLSLLCEAATPAQMQRLRMMALPMKARDVSMPGAQQGSEEHEEDELCVVCWDRPREVIFLNCGHMVRACSLSRVLLLLTYVVSAPALAGYILVRNAGTAACAESGGAL